MAKLNPFRFSTKYQDDETDMVYYGYRYLSTSTGRWLSRDPLEEEGGEGLYVFAANDPGCHIDLFGLKCSVVTGEIDLSQSIEVPLEPFVSADGNLGMHIYPSGKLCDCCGNSKAVKAQGSLTAQYEFEAGITLGQRINRTVLGINFMGFLGIRVAGNGSGGGSGEYKVLCDGTATATLSGQVGASIIGQAGSMGQIAWPRGWPRRLTGPPWGERIGAALMGEGTGGVTVNITSSCNGDKCKWKAEQMWGIKVTGRGEFGPVAVNAITMYENSWDGVSYQWETGNPFK